VATRFMRGLYNRCQRKVRYATQPRAAEALAVLERRGGHKVRMRAYHCDACGGWHIGHAWAKTA
jgi:hypothetical protein